MKYSFLACFAAAAYCALPASASADQFGVAAPAGYPAPAPSANQAAWLTPPAPHLEAMGQPPADQQWLTQIGYSNSASYAAYAAMKGPETQAPPVYEEPIEECDYCCLPPWVHRSGVFGELLYLRARDAEVAYAVPIDGAIVPPPQPPIQLGRVAVTDPDYTAGFRVGGMCALDECSSIVLSWSRFQSSTFDIIGTQPGLVLRSLVMHPGTANAGSDFLDAQATSDIDFDLVDVDYRAVWANDDLWALNYIVGVRYARLQQDFNGAFTSTGTFDTVSTSLNFDGGGFKLGLDGERHAAHCGLMVYGRTSASFIGGEFRNAYRQASDVDPIIVDTSWKAGRVVTILDVELGAGWQSQCGRVRLTAGYLFSGWFNAIPTDQWIQAVQQNNFVGLGDTVTFDGFTARAEYRF